MRSIQPALLTTTVLMQVIKAVTNSAGLVLWYSRPAAAWTAALPGVRRQERRLPDTHAASRLRFMMRNRAKDVKPGIYEFTCPGVSTP